MASSFCFAKQMASGGEDLKLHGFWGSPFALRVIWALKLKGIEYEYVEENLPEKSHLLLQYNPVHKKVPVLVHKGKPLAESLVIIEYIDETWGHAPLLPSDPYERAKARFWAKFADDKCYPALMSVFSSKDEKLSEAAKEVRDAFKTLEAGLEGRRFFGGEKIGFVDVAAGWLGCWAKIVEEIVGVKLLDKNEVPLLATCFTSFLHTPVVEECLPPHDKLIQLNRGFRNMLMGNAST